MAKVKAVPDGYSTVTVVLSLNGAAEAIDFYKKAFGAKERGRMPGPNGTIMHSTIEIGDSVIMLSDAMMGPPTQASVHLYVENADAAWKRAVDAGAQVMMPIGDMFWGDRYGVLTDKWGNRWSIGQHIEDVPTEEMGKRAAQAMEQMQPPG